MPPNRSRAAYRAQYEILDRALESAHGVQIRVHNLGEAYQLRQKLHYARTLDRELSMTVYEADNPLYGTSVYDQLIIQFDRDGDDLVVSIRPTATTWEVEEIRA